MNKNYLTITTTEDINDFLNIKSTLIALKYSYFINSYENNLEEFYQELVSILKETFLNYNNIYNCLIYSSIERFFDIFSQEMLESLYNGLKGKYDMNGKAVILIKPEEVRVHDTKNVYYDENEEKLGENIYFKIECEGLVTRVWEDAEDIYTTLDAIGKNEDETVE